MDRVPGLQAGRYRWRWRTGWADPSCSPPPPEPKRNDGERLDPPKRLGSDPCVDSAPSRSYYHAQVIKPRIAGCTRDEDMINTRGSSRGKRIALTFDDGPSGYTSQVIDILNRQGASGTFFVVGSEIPERTGLLRRMRAGGHEIGNHSQNHETGGASS